MRTVRVISVLALAASLAVPAAVSAADDEFTRNEAIAVVQSIVGRGLQCAAPGWSISGYSAEGGPVWTVHAYATHPEAPSRIDIGFSVASASYVTPQDRLAEQIIECAGGIGDAPVPVVRAFTKKGAVEPGETVGLEFAVKDETGRARVHLNVYQGGAWVLRWTRKVAAKSLANRYRAAVDLPDDLVGPLSFCVWAENAAGGASKGRPRSSCGRIALVTAIGKVSNGCGGAGWDTVVAIENYFGNTSTYTDEATGESYTVNFSRACNLHDAGYGGHTVRDGLHGGKLVDFQKWSREQVDRKFAQDIALLCEKKIPSTAAGALAACKDNYRVAFVRRWGSHFFDANLSRTGTQDEGSRPNT